MIRIYLITSSKFAVFLMQMLEHYSFYRFNIGTRNQGSVIPIGLSPVCISPWPLQISSRSRLSTGRSRPSAIIIILGHTPSLRLLGLRYASRNLCNTSINLRTRALANNVAAETISKSLPVEHDFSPEVLWSVAKDWLIHFYPDQYDRVPAGEMLRKRRRAI